MKCQVNSEKSQIFPNTRPTWFLLGKLVATYNFATSLQSPLRTNSDDGIWYLAVPKLYIIPRQCLCCRDLGSFASNDKHGLEEQWCHLARLTSRVEPFRMARLGHDGQKYNCMVSGIELEKYSTGHAMSNQQSEKQRFPNTTQNWIAFGKLVATYNFATSLFCTTQSPLWTNLDDGIWYLPVPKLYIIPRRLPLL